MKNDRKPSKEEVLFSKIVTFFELGSEERKKFLSKLHPEIHYGFDVVARIAMEQIEKDFSREDLTDELKEDIESQIAFATLTGYALYLFQNDIDPYKAKLNEKETTSELGEKWMKLENREELSEILKQIEFKTSLLLEKASQGRINMILQFHPELNDMSYKYAASILKNLAWSAHQGYILGILENSNAA